ncbi:ROK family protein [Caviibacter abscessus]|uniref:ROK family protein n=1 Tax=Caviibacter abscessus TaxID=1766719 RepID=UPI000833EE91|nr:ROK family protein [Caviibacter abscessus]
MSIKSIKYIWCSTSGKYHSLSKFEGVCPYHKDCFEGLASGPGIEKITGKKAYLLEKDDPIWESVANDITEALTSYILILSPQKIILGGGVMKQKQLFPIIRKKVLEKLNNYVYKKEIIKDIDNYIVYPKLGDYAGFYGSIALGV